jgi:hypothetical protein
MDGGDVLQDEPRFRDDIEDAGEATGDLGGFDLEDFGNLHAAELGLRQARSLA